jgi:hypothetical protein
MESALGTGARPLVSGKTYTVDEAGNAKVADPQNHEEITPAVRRARKHRANR